jgi:hypothetical protein
VFLAHRSVFIIYPAPLRTVLALLTHTAPHQYIYFVANRFTVIRGFGMGNRFRSFLNFSHDMHPLFPRRFSHLKSNRKTSCENRPIGDSVDTRGGILPQPLEAPPQ